MPITMARGDQFPDQQPRPAADLEHEPAPIEHGREQVDDPWSDGGGMESEPTMVHEREVVTVVRIVWTSRTKPKRL